MPNRLTKFFSRFRRGASSEASNTPADADSATITDYGIKAEVGPHEAALLGSIIGPLRTDGAAPFDICSKEAPYIVPFEKMTANEVHLAMNILMDQGASDRLQANREAHVKYDDAKRREGRIGVAPAVDRSAVAAVDLSNLSAAYDPRAENSREGLYNNVDLPQEGLYNNVGLREESHYNNVGVPEESHYNNIGVPEESHYNNIEPAQRGEETALGQNNDAESRQATLEKARSMSKSSEGAAISNER